MSKIYVGNLSWNTTDDILLEAFSRMGQVVDVIVAKDRKTGRSRGFGFVTFATETEADTAINEMNEVELDGRRVRVNRANTKPAGSEYSYGSSIGYDSSSYSSSQAGYRGGYGGYGGIAGEKDSNISPRAIFDPQPLVEVGYDDTRVMRESSAIVVDDDGSSEASSNGSGRSIFSIASRGSIGSAVTEMSRDIAYSAEQIEKATFELQSMLQDDEVLTPLYIAATQNDSIGPHRLERNFRRLLVSYSEHLKDEAHDNLEHLAARLVAVKAKFLAKSIVEKYMDSSNTGSVGTEVPERIDTDVEDGPKVDEDDSDEDGGGDGDPTTYDDVLQDFAKVREFLCGSDSFQTLRIQLQDFVNRNKSATKGPPPSVGPECATPWLLASGMFWTTALFIAFTGMCFAIFAPFYVLILGMVVQFLPWVYKLVLGWLDYGIITPMAEYIRRCVVTELLRQFWANMLLCLRMKPRCPPGNEQIYWQCKCGVRGIGHVREIRPGGIVKLKSHMERKTGVEFSSLSNPQSIPNQRFTVKYVWATVRGAVSTIWGSSQNATSLPIHHAAQPIISAQIVQNPNVQDPERLILMSCMHKKNQGKTLYQDDVTTLQRDRDLFYFLKARYRERRGKFRSTLSLRTVIGIYFIKFFVSISNNVEVRHHVTCCRDQSCECLPSKDFLEPGGSDPQYQCEPIPPDTVPPMLPDYLLHLFNSPFCIDPSEKEVFVQLPKRTKGKLTGKGNRRAKGWGIFFEEGWDLVKIAWLYFLVVFLGSLLFAVIWAIYQKDVQGAFGISAWWVTIGGSTLALFAISSSRV